MAGSAPLQPKKSRMSRFIRLFHPTVPNMTVAFLIVVTFVNFRLSKAPSFATSLLYPRHIASSTCGSACGHGSTTENDKQPLNFNAPPEDTRAKAFDADVAANARRARPMPLCANQGSARTFLMVFMGHSGSSAMLSELRRHPLVYVERMELVDHSDTPNATQALASTRSFFDRGLSQGKIPGFKIRPNHILTLPTEFRNLLTEFNTRIIWQYRQNLFKASIGEYSARYLNDTSAVEGLRRNLSMSERCKEGIGCSFRIDNISYLHTVLKEKVRSHHLISKAVNILGQPDTCVREVPYEDYLYDREATIGDIMRFLGIPQIKTEPERFKATGDNMCDVVQNWDDICDAFYGCITWQHMLDDARNQCFCRHTSGPTTYCDAHFA